MSRLSWEELNLSGWGDEGEEEVKVRPKPKIMKNALYMLDKTKYEEVACTGY